MAADLRRFLRKRKLPHQLRRNSSRVFDPAHDSIKVMTLHVSKGLEFPVVALVGAVRLPVDGVHAARTRRCSTWGYAGETAAGGCAKWEREVRHLLITS